MIHSLKLPSLTLFLLSLLMGSIVGVMAMNLLLAHRIGVPVEQVTPFLWFEASDVIRRLHAPAFAEALKIGGMVGIATVIGCLIFTMRPEHRSPHGDARWATRREIAEAGLLDEAGVILGKLGSPRSRAPFLRSASDAYSNTLLVAPPGGGKGVGVVIPTLLTWPGSAVVLDVKGENLAVTAGQRQEMGDTVFIFAPYDPDGNTHRFNPLEPIRQIGDADRRYSALRLLATHLLTSQGKADEPFIEGARELFTATASVALDTDEPTLGHVLRLLAPTDGTEDIGNDAIDQMMAKRLRGLAEQASHPSARTSLLQYSAYDPKTIGTFLSVLKSCGLGAWADPAIDRATSGNDFDLDTLRGEPQTIYIVISPNEMEALAPVARLFFQSVTAALQSRMPTPATDPLPVLLLLDEFKALGRMDTILNAATVLRGYGGRMLFVVQGIPNLEEVYGRAGAEGLMNACQLHAYMSINDPRTKAMLSRSLGTREVVTEQESTSRTLGKSGTSRTRTEQRSAARLLSEDEINRIGPDTILLLPQNARPIRARKVRYFEDRALRGLAGLAWRFVATGGSQSSQRSQRQAGNVTGGQGNDTELRALIQAFEFLSGLHDVRDSIAA